MLFGNFYGFRYHFGRFGGQRRYAICTTGFYDVRSNISETIGNADDIENRLHLSNMVGSSYVQFGSSLRAVASGFVSRCRSGGWYRYPLLGRVHEINSRLLMGSKYR